MEMTWVLIAILSVVAIVVISFISQVSAEKEVDDQFNQIMHNEVVEVEVKPGNLSSPAQIDRIKVTVPQGWDFPCCWVQFKNIGEKSIVSINYDITCFDSFGTPVGDPPLNLTNVNMQDEHARKGEVFGFEKYVSLPNHPTTRKVNIEVRKILYDDGSLWEFDKSDAKLA